MLVAAVGSAEMIRGDWVKPGAVVIDVGINRVAPGRQGSSATSPSTRRRSARGHHAGARRRRPDDDRVPAGEHARVRPSGGEAR